MIMPDAAPDPAADAPPFTIRPATRADVPAVVRLLADDPLGARREVVTEPLPAAYWSAFEALTRQAGNTLLIAESEGIVVGCLQLTLLPGLSHQGMLRAQIEGVRVSAAMRGRRIGEALVREAEQRARAAGAGLVQLTSDASRTDAHRFYARLGYAASHVGMKRKL
jgi:ribosomal protein S18 acetylase RimI-like enzyme